ncbi:MAG TPA: glycosyltransferase family 4 protein [Verrucomicrobiota bacterium]|nr:glycosyltransferase family 4 protein [Verrucomicrobiota bacterium]HRZ37780.1 glycosyltransferase family 4 protein [Candidatus Paceibacterota bacterium]HRZ56450.1 glycosyltransferase family 4 protein [Candidatus Paceibacterota bacterium]
MNSDSPPAGRMRRVVFSNYDSVGNPYYGGGGARAIHEIARRLTSSYDVRVVTGQFPGNCARIVDGVAYEPIGLRRAGPYLGQILFQLCLPWRAAHGDYDLWVESLTPPFSTACLPWFTRKPVAALTQVLAGVGMTRKYGLPFAAIERLGLRTYRHAIVLSTHLRGVVTRANPRLRTVVIPNGVSPALIDLPVRRDERHLLFLGRIDIGQKGLDLWIQALAAIAPRLGPPILIAGAGPARQEEQLRRRIASLGLGGKVRLLGKVDDAAKSELLRQSFLMVMPSRYEASPLVLLEAFCHAVPVVVFDIPELSDIPGDCCVKVPAFDTRAFGEAVLDLVTNEARRSALGRAAKAFARRFSWDDLARQYAAFFEEMLSDTTL